MNALGQDSWAVASTDGTGLLFYGQTLCPGYLATDQATAPHTYTHTSGSIVLQSSGSKSWSISSQNLDVLGSRLVVDDNPVPVQVFDAQDQIAYTFVYDLFNSQLGTQLWKIPAGHLPNIIAQPGQNTTMVTSQPPAVPTPSATLTPTPVATTAPTLVPTASTTAPGPVMSVPPPGSSVQAAPTSVAPAPVSSTPITPPPAVANAPPAPRALVRRAPGDNVTLAPFVDVGCAVYTSGTIVVLGGGKPAGVAALTGDDVDTNSGYYKMDRCWVYTIATNNWVKQTLTAPGGSFPAPRRLAALLVVGNQIYMHGGNTTLTDPLTAYSNELWILNTQTWTWTTGPASQSGRASHTLISTNGDIVTLSGFEFLTSTAKAAPNAFPMIYNLGSSSWSTQFGNITPSFFSQYGAAIIGGSVGGFLLIVIIASIFTRICRRKRGPRGAKAFTGFNRTNSRKPFTSNSNNISSDALATSAAAVAGAGGAAGAASRLSGMWNDQTQHDPNSQIDLSALPRNSDATMHDLPLYQNSFTQKQQQFGNNSPYQQQAQAQFHAYPTQIQHQQQQQVPLMSANALEQQGNAFSTPYHDDDDDEVEIKDHHSPQHQVLHQQPQGSVQFAESTSPPRSYQYMTDRSQTQSFHLNNNNQDRPMVHSPPERHMSSDSYNGVGNRPRSNSNLSMHSNGSTGNFHGNNINNNNINRPGGGGSGGDLLSGFP